MRKDIPSRIVMFASLLVPVLGFSQSGRISGYMFGDYYYLATHHDEELEGRNGFWFRRVYFTYDQGLSEAFSVRFRLELNSPGDFTSDSRLEPFLKDAYLRWRKSQHTIVLGLSPTPTWNHLEGVWGYRSVERTPGDLYRFGSSRDIGLSFRGSFDAQSRFHYHFMLANGNSTRAETNKGKKILLSLRYQFTPAISFEVYGDIDERPGATDQYMVQGFLGYRGESVRLGAQVMHQTQERVGTNRQIQVLSLFGVRRLAKQLWAFARFDRTFDPIPGGPGVAYTPFVATSEINFLLLGIDFRPHEHVQLMPNVEFIRYNENDGVRPGSDLIPRLSFFYQWQ